MISKKNILDFEARRNIYKFIEENPGLHQREISRRLKIPFSTVRYHLRFLKKSNLIIEKPDNRYSRFYISNKTNPRERKLLVLLRNKTIRNMLIVMLWDITSSRTTLSNFMDIPPNTVSFYLNKLLEAGIIEPVEEVCDGYTRSRYGTMVKRVPVGREKLYRFVNTAWVYLVMIKYRDSFYDKHIKEMLKDMWRDDDVPMPKKWRTLQDRIDTTIDLAFEFFPIPWCA